MQNGVSTPSVSMLIAQNMSRPTLEDEMVGICDETPGTRMHQQQQSSGLYVHYTTLKHILKIHRPSRKVCLGAKTWEYCSQTLCYVSAQLWCDCKFLSNYASTRNVCYQTLRIIKYIVRGTYRDILGRSIKCTYMLLYFVVVSLYIFTRLEPSIVQF